MQTCSTCGKECPNYEFISIRGGKRTTCNSCALGRRKIDPNMPFCENEDCKNNAFYNILGSEEPIFCDEHKTNDMVRIFANCCRYPYCKKRPHYGVKNGKPYYCIEHKKPGTFDITRSICLEGECTTRACFNIRGETKGIYCVKHKKPDMIDLTRVKCLECSVSASYNFPDKKNYLYCTEHKKPGMINLINPMCTYDDCKISAAFGYLEDMKPVRCLEHAKPGMTNVKTKRCEFPGCETQAVYNTEDQKGGKFCVKHKEDNMIDVKNRCKKCEKCDKRANFGLTEDGKPRFCANHKDDDMKDLTHKKCGIDGCEVQPIFNIKGAKGLRCTIHKSPEMINVKETLCTIDNCTSRAYYGFPQGKLERCQKHRQEGMIKNPRRKCKVCKKPATHGINQTQHCETHAEEDEISLVEQKCSSCGRIGVISSNGICVNFCEMDEYYAKYKKFQKLKQLRIQNLLTEKITQRLSYVEQCVNTSHTNERVDFLYECKTHNVSVDVDEFAHRNYCTPKGEFGRMINLFFALGQDRPTIFIRYNPDYFRINGKKQTISEKEREETLIYWIKHYLKKSPGIKDHPEYKCFILYLFYDEYDKNNVKVYPFDPYALVELECEKCEKTFFIESMYKGHKCPPKRKTTK